MSKNIVFFQPSKMIIIKVGASPQGSIQEILEEIVCFHRCFQ